jgi:hypothetical protein
MSALVDHCGDIYRGAFSIIDNTGQCPSDVNRTDFQHSAIKAHLLRHTYYHDVLEKKTRVDAEDMHDFIRNLCSHEESSDAVTSSAYNCQSGEDRVDPFFRLGTDKLPPKLLALYGYEKLSFREEDLPKYAPPPVLKQPSGTSYSKHIQRSFWILIQDIEATKASREHASYKYRDFGSRLDALAALIRDFSLDHFSAKEKVLRPCASKQLHKSFLGTWKAQKDAGVANASSPWESGIKGWKHSYLESIKENCTEITLAKSLQSYDPGNAVSLSTDLIREVKDVANAHHDRTVDEADSVEFDGDVIAVYDGKVNSRTGRVDGIADDLQRVRSVSAAAAAIMKPVPTSPLEKSARATREAARTARSDAQRATTCSDILDEVSDSLSSLSSSYTETSRSTLVDHKRKRVINDTHSRGKRQNAMKDSSSTTTTHMLPDNGKDQSDVASWIVHRLGNEVVGDEPLVAHNVFVAHPPAFHQPLETAHHCQTPERPVLTALNLIKLESELKDIYRKLSDALLQLLDGVGEVGEEMMPLDPHPPPSTLELHVRCWGDEWLRIRAQLKHSKLFSVPDVAMSLCSAYLFDNIFSRRVQNIQVSLDPEGDSTSGSIRDGKNRALFGADWHATDFK